MGHWVSTGVSVPLPRTSNSAAVPSRPVPSIDPRLAGLPLLPDSDDDDLTHGPTVAKAQGRAPAKKVASSRREPKAKQCASQPMNKGKARASEPISSRKRKVLLFSDDEDIKEAEAKRGRPRGSSNYTIDEVMHLLDLLEAELPLGQKGWNSVYKKYTKWARNNNYISRTIKSLDTKYKQLIKTTMPTGDSRCPPDVKRAHQIEDLIKERACTRDLNDSGFDSDAAHDNPACKIDAGEEDDDDEVEIVETPSVKKEICHAIVRHPDPLATITCRENHPHGMELVTKLADAFDPAAFKARDAERADRSLQNTQILTLSQQLCDLHATIESLRAQITNHHSDLHKVERACDRADMKLELFEISRSPKHPPSWSRSSDSEKENTPLCPVASSSRHQQKHRSWDSHDLSNSHDSSRHYFRNASPIEQPFSIRPPSPFYGTMDDVSNSVDPLRLSPAADTQVEGSQSRADEALGDEAML
ncbi:hypothetical protein LshimejAT787_1500120 [Lyophyllum shimeji]|uniref:DUF6818 domain-containing protein n=1 Tax=Lyophyllum shimeji TaxID=47721 RepID=A0A9P3PXJ5_LYOSH|nr:hypothetical protein LshimejAT787_1500120 [Lyophyllum shimeji]